MRSAFSLVIFFAVIGSVVSQFFAPSYESLQHQGVDFEYESTIDQAKVREVAEAIKSTSSLGNIKNLRVILDTEDEKHRLWFCIKSGFEQKSAFLGEIGLVTNVVASKCFDENSFEMVLCNSKREPLKTIAPTPGYNQTVQEDNFIVFYNGMSAEDAQMYMSRIRASELVEEPGICRVAKTEEHYLFESYSSKEYLDTYTEEEIAQNAFFIRSAFFDGQATRVQYGEGVDYIQDSMTRTLPSIGFGGEELAYGEITIDFGAPFSKEAIETVAKRLKSAGLKSGACRMTAANNALDFRMIRSSELTEKQWLAITTYYAREVKAIYPEYAVTAILSDENFDEIMSTPVESENGQQHRIGSDFLFTTGDFTEEQIGDFIEAMKERQLYPDAGSRTWLTKTDNEITLSIGLLDPTSEDDDNQKYQKYLRKVAEDMDENVFPKATFKLSVCTIDNIEKLQLWPVTN